MSDQPLLGWIDLETTGLKPEYETILEVGVVITTADPELEIVDECSWVIRHSNTFREQADPFVEEMHTKNGLWKESGESTLWTDEAESSVCQYLFDRLGDSKPPLAGSSVHFDRAFLAVHMPCVLKKFSYRNLDVSSIKEASKVLRPELALPPTPEDDKGHRALDDLHHSIDELKYYNRVFFSEGI